MCSFRPILLIVIAAICVNRLLSTDSDQLPIFIKDDLFLEIREPKEIAYLFRIRPALDFGKPLNYTAHGVKLVLAEPSSACQPLENDVLNRVVFVRRGSCSFVEKALNVESGDGLLMVVHDDEMRTDEHLVDMVTDPKLNVSINLPSYFISGHDGWMIRNAMMKSSVAHLLVDIPVNISQKHLHSQLPPWNLW